MQPISRPPEVPADRNRWLLGGLAVILALSLYLALNRVYQVDEAQGAYSAWIQGAGLSGQLFTHAPFYLLPFGWAAGHADSAEAVFNILRLGFWGLWCINLTLFAWAAGARPWSRKGATLAVTLLLAPPMWTYGLEARHENIILAGLLSMWAFARWGRLPGWLAFFSLGGLSVLLQASAFKSVAYWLPLSLAAMAVPHPDHGKRPRLIVGWVAGAVASAILVFAVEHAAGLWPAFWAEQTRFLHGATQVDRFSPLETLLKLLRQCPSLIAFVATLGAWQIRRSPMPRDRHAFYAGPWPELILAAACLLLLFINPNPFPYNLLTVSAALMLAAVALAGLAADAARDPAARRALLATVIGAQAILAGVHVYALLSKTNDRQVELMKAAEALTDPQKDRVYDSAGLVPTRKSVGYVWFMNIANVQAFRSGALSPFMEGFRATPPAVVIPTYRFTYLDPRDEQEIEQSYLAVAPDLWVAGHVFNGGPDAWRCPVGGRYMIKFLAGDGAAARLDGKPVPEGPFVLPAGGHAWTAPDGTKAVAAWVGPRLNDLPRLEGEATPGVFPIPNSF